MRKALLVTAAAVTALGIAAMAAAGPARTKPTTFVVVYNAGASPAAAHAAIKAAGGRLAHENRDVGVATVVSTNPRFVLDASSSSALVGAAHNMPIGHVPATKPRAAPKKFDLEKLQTLRKPLKGYRQRIQRFHHERAEPLAPLQWDMQMIHATTDGSYAEQQGKKKVLVGIIDTGVDGTHPDIAPNFNSRLSRNFTTDITSVPPNLGGDGPCEFPSCKDPANHDDNGHGTHVASEIGSPINGLGMAGIAPRVSLVNLRAGQDSGYFFLQASVDALTYAGDHGIDVVNMSYYIDPWLFNCPASAPAPEDSATSRAEQQTIITATQRALDYAHSHGVTLIAAAGNGHMDEGHPTTDDTSPDFPSNAPYHRTVTNACLDLPTEGNNVMSISSIGPTKRKADYSNFGLEQITVAAPGGFFRDDPWDPSLAGPPLGTNNPQSLAAGIPNEILAAYPKNVAEAEGTLNPDGTPNTPFVVRDCNSKGTCAYYQWIQGTSMASPHAVGVAALIIAEYGKTHHGRFGLDPAKVEQILRQTATDTPCPEPRLHSYTDKGRSTSFNALCEGTTELNGFYGDGIVDALRAVEGGKHDHGHKHGKR